VIDKQTETAYAKLNLALHVREKMANGYHALETIFAFVDRGDDIAVQSDESISLSISGPFANGLDSNDNLVIKAAQLLQSQQRVKSGAKLHLQKNLPIASGIGGGSADAAATMRLLNRFWETNLTEKQLAEIARPLGADVPACIYSKTCEGTGTGQEIELISSTDLDGKAVLLANPLVELSTAAVFKHWDGKDKGGLNMPNLVDVLKHGRNDLEFSAVSQEPKVAAILKLLLNTNPIASKMSGSGATCFGVYENTEMAEIASKEIQILVSPVWTMVGKFR